MFDLVYLQSWAMGLIPWLVGFLAILLIDIVTGIVVALYDGVFEWEKSVEGLRKGGAYLWMWIAVELLTMLPIVLKVEIPDYYAALADYGPKVIFSAIVVGKYVGSILANVSEFLQLQHTKLVRQELINREIFRTLPPSDDSEVS